MIGIELFYEFVIDGVESGFEVALVYADDNVELAGALVDHLYVYTRIGDCIEDARRCSAGFYHTASYDCNECKSAFKRYAVGLGSSCDRLDNSVLVSVKL